MQEHALVQVLALHQALHRVRIVADTAGRGRRTSPSDGSSSEMKKREQPGSPCRPARPRSWLSMRRLSCRFVPITYSPPSSATPSPSWMSVPRPAMLVEIVTAPRSPACATMAASCSSLRAFNTRCGMSGELRGSAARIPPRSPSPPGSAGRWHARAGSPPAPPAPSPPSSANSTSG